MKRSRKVLSIIAVIIAIGLIAASFFWLRVARKSFEITNNPTPKPSPMPSLYKAPVETPPAATPTATAKPSQKSPINPNLIEQNQPVTSIRVPRR